MSDIWVKMPGGATSLERACIHQHRSLAGGGRRQCLSRHDRHLSSQDQGGPGRVWLPSGAKG